MMGSFSNSAAKIATANHFWLCLLLLSNFISPALLQGFLTTLWLDQKLISTPIN